MANFIHTSITTTGEILTGDESGLITSTGGIYVFAADAVTATTGDNVLHNDGYLYTYGFGYSAINADGGTFDMINGVNGYISAENPTRGLIDMNLSVQGRIVNHGTLTAPIRNVIDFLHSDGTANFQLINSGHISSLALGTETVDVDVGTGSTHISNSGEIVGQGTTLDLAGDTINNSLHVIMNSGIITSLANDAIMLNLGNISSAQITNSGTITAWNEAVQSTQNTEVRINNSGLMQTIGRTFNKVIDLQGRSDLIRNTGTLIGNVELGAGNDLYEGNGGVINGTVLGELNDDSLHGGDFTDVFDGGEGADQLLGRGGDDSLLGGSGNDVLLGGAGNDVLMGGSNDDTLNGNAGDDTLLGDGGNDILVGQDGSDILDGGAGIDTLDGGNGDDLLEGGDGNDILRGRAGEDDLAGGLGLDLLTGGQDADSFVFRSVAETAVGAQRDQILDFEPGLDLIVVAGLSPGVFEFKGTAAFAPSGNPELRLFETPTGSTIVQLDANGDGVTDAEIRVANVTGLTAQDFVL